jgi:hypothetical protein
MDHIVSKLSIVAMALWSLLRLPLPQSGGHCYLFELIGISYTVVLKCVGVTFFLIKQNLNLLIMRKVRVLVISGFMKSQLLC